MKKGFTLAEVLITLGIIGVVAALTAPALVQNAGNAKAGPTLAKAVSTFETATANMFQEEGVSKITSLVEDTDNEGQNEFFEKLSNYMKIDKIEYLELRDTYMMENASQSPYNTTVFGTAPTGPGYLMQDGIMYLPRFRPARYISFWNSGKPIHKQLIGSIVIDINGLTKPNKVGKDIFGFALYNDGSLKPMGSTGWNITQPSITDDNLHWTKTCTETNVTNAWGCAGSIFENNLKVIYQ